MKGRDRENSYILNIKNLERFVVALQGLPDSVKQRDLYMGYSSDASILTETGLIGIVGEDIREMENYHDIGVSYPFGSGGYEWYHALDEFLGFGAHRGHGSYFRENPKIWGNDTNAPHGCRGSIYNQKSNVFKASIMIDWWTGVLERAKAADALK